MKTILYALGLTATLTLPVLAQHVPQPHFPPPHYSGEVVVGDRNIGADPDVNIRSELSRDAATSLGAND